MRNLKLYNVDRLKSAVFGGDPSGNDFCVVVDLDQVVPHPITGRDQPKLVFSGTLTEAWAFIKRSQK